MLYYMHFTSTTVFTQFIPQGTIIFSLKNKDKTLRIVPHCGIIRGSTTIILNLPLQ